eukprot:scaffold3146_cov245-Pinguiococcus_pyrenoidosus.AAC.5
MHSIPLLNPAEEAILGTRIQRMLRIEEAKPPQEHFSVDAWAAEANCTVAELQEQLQLGQEAKKELVRRNMRLVVAVARRYQNLGVALPDLIQEGSFGLIKAAERYDPWRGFRYALRRREAPRKAATSRESGWRAQEAGRTSERTHVPPRSPLVAGSPRMPAGGFNRPSPAPWRPSRA